MAYLGIFNDSFPPILDGVTLAVQNYVHWLRKLGHDTCVVTPWNPEKVETECKVLKYLSFPIFNRRPYRYGYPQGDPFIWKRVRNTPFSLIHCHCPFSSGRLGVYASRKQGVPLIGTFHSKYRSDFEHSLRHTPWLVDRVMKRVIAFFNECDHVWIPQISVAETVREYGYRGELTVVENGNDLASRYDEREALSFKDACRAEMGVSASKMVLLFVGQHILEKGIGLIAESLKKLQGRVDFEMHFVGKGYAVGELESYLRANIEASRYFMHGQIRDREQMAKLYSAADLFLFPSAYDNAPLVVREAAAMCTPAIVLRGSTASEPIRDGENGFLAAYKADEYADLIEMLSADRGRLRRAAIGARRTLTRSWQDVVAEVDARYRDIILTHSACR